MPSPDKVTIHLETSIQLEVTDNGYLGSDVTIAKHLEKAQRDAEGWVYLIQKGGTQPERVRARVKVVGVTIVPGSS